MRGEQEAEARGRGKSGAIGEAGGIDIPRRLETDLVRVVEKTRPGQARTRGGRVGR